MPAQHSIRLYNDQSLFPRAQLAGQENDEQSVAPSESWAFTLPFENDKLLTKQSVFQHQLQLGASEIQGNVEEQGMVVWFCPLAKPVFDISKQRLYTFSDGVHRLPLRSGLKGCDCTTSGEIWGKSRTDVLFGQDNDQLLAQESIFQHQF